MSTAEGLTNREAAIDALIRFVCALDNGDTSLSESSLTSDAIMELDFAHTSVNAVHGREKIAKVLMDAVGTPLDTTHMATNIRCSVRGDTAELSATIFAQHFRGGEGLGAEFGEYYMNGNLYWCTAVRDGEWWRMNKVIISGAWTLGNPAVMKV